MGKFSDKQYSRRNILKYSAGGLACLGLPAGVLGQTSDVTALTKSVSLIYAGGANVLAVSTSDGLVLVDSGPASETETLQAALDSLDTNDVQTLFNTHWHPEQVGGNAMLKNRGARIVAHQKTLQHLSTRYYIPFENQYHEPLPEDAWPTDIFHSTGNMTSGNETIEYGALVQPHTDADIYVWFRDANVLAAGDAVSPLLDPVLDWYGGGWLGGRVNSQDMLLEIVNDDTRIVPAFGPVMTKADLQAERDITQEVYNRVLDLIRQGCSAGCMLAEGALDGLPRKWQNPDKFLYDAYKGMWAHHYNLAPNIL